MSRLQFGSAIEQAQYPVARQSAKCSLRIRPTYLNRLFDMQTIQRDFKDLVRYWTFPHLHPRRFHAYGVGSPKSGTHSLEAVFSRHYRTWHEPERERFMRIITARADGDMSTDEAREQVRRLDRSKWLELNSSWLNFFLLDLLLELHPQAKFILTIRDCYSWLDSALNHILTRPEADYHERFHKWYAGSLWTGPHQDGDRVLEEYGLWPLDGWLRFWSEHNTRVLALVPSDRLLIVRTREIGQDIPKMAEFLGVPLETLDTTRSHEHKALKKYGLLSKIDPDYLQDRVDARCKDLMERFFPEIQRLADVPGYRLQDVEAQVG